MCTNGLYLIAAHGVVPHMSPHSYGWKRRYLLHTACLIWIIRLSMFFKVAKTAMALHSRLISERILDINWEKR